jgi:hypothetical protein
MNSTTTSSREKGWLWLVLGALLLLFLLRLTLGPRPLDDHSPRALLDASFALLLAALVLMLALGLGRRMIRWLQLPLHGLELTVFSVPLGLGAIAYGVLALGLAGFLQVWALALWLVAVGVIGLRDLATALQDMRVWLSTCRSTWRRTARWQQVLLIIFAVLLILTLFQALTPPWDYDSLLYHLQGPRLFLQAGRIQNLPENWLTSYPFTVQMLFLIGLRFESDSFAKVINMSYGVLLSLMTYALARRYLSQTHAFVATAVLIGIPIGPIWGSLAYIDMAWATSILLGIYAVMLWRDDRRRRWLIVAGLGLGLAAGTKYFALGTAAIIGLWVIWNDVRRGWKILLTDALTYGIVAGLVAAPWYVKSWLWTGSPLYPIVFAGTDRIAQQARLWTAYMGDYGVGRSLIDYLLLPLNLYLRYYRFGTFLGNIEIPSPLYLLLVLYPWTPRPKVLNGLIGVAALSFVLWAMGAQQTRFLLPLFPLLSILVSVVLVDGIGRFRRRWRTIAVGLMAGMLAVTLFYSVLFFVSVEPYSVVSGLMSKDDFMRRVTTDYAALNYIQTKLPANTRTLMLWDGRGYYCDERCLPDVDHARWTYLVATHPTIDKVVAELRRLGVTHLLTSVESVDFMLQHDPTGDHLRAARFFANEFQPKCLREVFTARGTTVYELTCP